MFRKLPLLAFVGAAFALAMPAQAQWQNTPFDPGTWKIPNFPQNETQFSGQTKIQFRYTIWNNSGTTVRFRLPSGRIYTLAHGERGNYVFTGYKPQAVLHLFNTGKSYHLSGGDHKFWWMPRERQIGFDANYGR